MRKNTESMMKGAALGLLAGGAVGAAGAYVAQKNPKEMKKMMKKAGASAERATETFGKTGPRRMLLPGALLCGNSAVKIKPPHCMSGSDTVC